MGARNTDPTHTRYRYELEGIDRDWHPFTSAQRIATYTTLPPGQYNLHVQASTNTSPWTEPGIMLRVRVLPPWWSTWWFRTFYLLLLLVGVWIAYRYRLPAMSKALALRLQERADERTRVSRELHDTLMETIQASRIVADCDIEPRANTRQPIRTCCWLSRMTTFETRKPRTISSCP